MPPFLLRLGYYFTVIHSKRRLFCHRLCPGNLCNKQCGFRFEWTFSLTKLVCVGVPNEVLTFTLKLTKQSFVGFKSL